jgi:alpha-tubulin suppressor-like RCC1 family protein
LQRKPNFFCHKILYPNTHAIAMKHSLLINSLLFTLLAFPYLPAVSQVVDGGNGHAIILDKQGNVWTSGRNNYGQLGNGTLKNSPDPIQVKGLHDIVAISRGYDHSIALSKEGNLYLWGRNNYGQLGVYSVKDQWTPQQLPRHKDFIAVEGGHWHTVGLKKNGTVWCWGHNFYGELGNGTREHSEWPVVVHEETKSGVAVLKDVVSIASVGYHTLALKSNGTVWGWGANSIQELGGHADLYQKYAIKIAGIPKIKEIAVGWHHSVALDEDGNLWVWGSDPAFQFNEASTKRYAQPTLLLGLPKFTKIACGSWHSLAIDVNKNVWAWGKNHFGMLGTGDTISHSTPVLIDSLDNIAEIGGGCFQSIAVDEAGQVYTFGDNPSGQLGLGNFARCHTPTAMPLDFNGLPRKDPVGNSGKTAAAQLEKSPVPAESVPSTFDATLLLKIGKYLLLFLSLGLNIYFIRRFRLLKSKLA